MEIVYAKGEATATDVLEDLSDAPARTAVRTFQRILEEKGHLKHTKRRREFVHSPIRRREIAGQSAFQRVIQTFFDGSLEKAVAAHLNDPDSEISPEHLQRLSALIRQARSKKE